MPLLRFDLIEGRSESELKKIIDVHATRFLLETLHVTETRSLPQVVHEHKRFSHGHRGHRARICQIRTK